MADIVILGSVNADHVITVPRFPHPGETLTGHGYQVIPGGKGANQAVAVARLGGDAQFIACIGDDAVGSQMKQGFAADKLGVQAVDVVPDCPTGIALIQVSEDGENTIIIDAAANARLTPEQLQPHLPLIANAGTLLMQLETPIATLIAAAEHAYTHQTRVVLNPAPAQTLPVTLLEYVDLLTPNETEAEALSGVPVTDQASACVAAHKLQQMGVSEILITMGKQGACYVGPGYEDGLMIPALCVNAVDTTAAGDTFNGALVVAQQEGMALPEAIQFANRAAAISVTRHGAQTSIPYRHELSAS